MHEFYFSNHLFGIGTALVAVAVQQQGNLQQYGEVFVGFPNRIPVFKRLSLDLSAVQQGGLNLILVDAFSFFDNCLIEAHDILQTVQDETIHLSLRGPWNLRNTSLNIISESDLRNAWMRARYNSFFDRINAASQIDELRNVIVQTMKWPQCVYV